MVILLDIILTCHEVDLYQVTRLRSSPDLQPLNLYYRALRSLFKPTFPVVRMWEGLTSISPLELVFIPFQGHCSQRVNRFRWKCTSWLHAEGGQAAVRTCLSRSHAPWTFTLLLETSPDCSGCSPGKTSKGPEEMLPFPHSFLGR